MLLILYIIFFDPTLPLPDLSKVVFPEPRLWIPQERDHVTIEGYGIDHYGGMLSFQMGYFDLQAIYDHNLDWDTTDRATLNVNQHIITHNFWLKPSVTAMYYARNRTYLNSQASCALNYYLPWSLLSGQVMADNWFINSDHHRQLEASFSIIFDRLKFPYCIGILARLDDRTYGYSFTNIRIGSFFIELSSPFPANFPSPRLEIKYVEPGFVIGQKIESGIFEQTFQTYLDINSPGNFSYPAPSESLYIRLNTFCKFKILGQSLILNNTYAYWQCYPTWNRYLRHASIPEMQNNDLMVNLVNTIKFSIRCNIKNSVGVGYYWSDGTITYRPRYSIDDTFSITLSHSFTEIMLRYYPRRPGFKNELSPWFTASTRIGFRIKFSEIFLIINNIGSFQDEVFDGLFYQPRRYAAGLKFAFDL